MRTTWLIVGGLFLCSVAAIPLKTEPAEEVQEKVIVQNKLRQDEDDDNEVEFNTDQPFLTEIIGLGLAAGVKLLNITTPSPVQVTQPQKIQIFSSEQLGQVNSPALPQSPQVVVPQQPQIIYVTVPSVVVPPTSTVDDEDDESES